METPDFNLPSIRIAEVFEKINELKIIYELNSTLMKKRDEETEDLKNQLAAYKEQLASVEDMNRKLKDDLENAHETIQEKSDLFAKCKDELQYAKRTIRVKSEELAETENLFFKAMTELEIVKEDNQEKSDQIAALLAFDFSDSNENDEVPEESSHQLHPSNSKLALSPSLSPIREENISEIPDYYDECISYRLSLQFSIGSDSKIFRENASENAEIKKSKSENNFDKIKTRKLQSSISAASIQFGDACNHEKEKSAVNLKSKKKKPRYNVLYNIACL